MRIFKAATLAVGVLLGAGQIAGCASEPTRRSTGRYVDDAAITAKVKTALARDRDVSALAVNVTTYRGIVQLSGFVDDESVARKAGEIAHGVDGVRDVYNDLHVAPRS